MSGSWGAETKPQTPILELTTSPWIRGEGRNRLAVTGALVSCYFKGLPPILSLRDAPITNVGCSEV